MACDKWYTSRINVKTADKIKRGIKGKRNEVINNSKALERGIVVSESEISRTFG